MSLKKFWVVPVSYSPPNAFLKAERTQHLNAFYITFRVPGSAWAVARRLSSRGLQPHSLIWLPTGAALSIRQDRWTVTTMRRMATELAKGNWTASEIQRLDRESLSQISIGTWKGDRA
jgi:hypothetical protein